MPVVTVTKNANGVNVNPDPAVIAGPNNQTITFNFVPNAASFSNPPLTLETNPPAPYVPWPSSGTLTQGPGTNQWTANANNPIPRGAPAQMYKYTVNYPGGNLDPGIENQPYPPGMEDDDDQGEDGKGPHHNQP